MAQSMRSATPKMTEGTTVMSVSSSRSRQTPQRRRGTNETTAVASSSVSGSRASSQPKQRATSRGKAKPVSKDKEKEKEKEKAVVMTPYEAGIARVMPLSQGKNETELAVGLQQLLLRHEFVDAAYLIEAVPTLKAKYRTSDVVRLMLEMQQLDGAAQLVRELELRQDQALVTVLINELVRATRFQAAVRCAQEFVENFGNKEAEVQDQQATVTWTPPALMQAMLRAQHFKTALKFAKQFNMLDTFPPAVLVESMLETGSFEDAVSSVMEYRLFTEFPLEALSVRMLRQRQWACAFKCIGKLPTKELIDQGCEALVREAARAGDFVATLKYLRECKLDKPDTNHNLLKFVVDCLLGNGEYYKAIKYSIKFGLNEPSTVEGADNSESAQYGTCTLIRQAIEFGQYHVASTYIKRFHLQDVMGPEMAFIHQGQERMLLEFRQYMMLRESQYQRPENQLRVRQILGSKLLVEWADETKELDSVVSVEEEIVPRKIRQRNLEEEVTSGERDEDDAEKQEEQGDTIETVRTSLSEVETMMSRMSGSSEATKQSRFSFARTATAETAIPAHPLTSLVGEARSQAVPSISQDQVVFNMSQLAAGLESSQTNTVKHPTESAQPSAPPLPLGPTPPPYIATMPTAPPLPPQPPAEPGPPGTYYSERTSAFNAAPGYPPPPPPPPPHPSPALSMLFPNLQPNFPQDPAISRPSNSNAFDVSSLVMQFHQPAMPVQSNINVFGMPPPPPLYPPMNGPPLPPPNMGMMPMMPPGQAPSTFKPSMTYTSVTTTRQKRATK